MPPKRKKKSGDESEDEKDEFHAEPADASSSDESSSEGYDDESENSKKPTEEEFEEAPTKKVKGEKEAIPKKSVPKKSPKPKGNSSTTTKKTGKDGKEKKTVTRDVGKIEEMLLEYVQKHNRPHAVQSLLVAFRNGFGKASCEKALANLCKRGEVTLKQAGKAKVYYVAQKDLESVSKDELITMDEEIKEKNGELKGLLEELKDVQKKRDEAVSSLTTDQLKDKIVKQKDDLLKKSEKLKTLESTTLISDEDMKKLDVNLEKYLKEWKKRKGIARGLIDQVGEMQSKKNSEVMEDLGLDPDTVDINTIGKL